MAMYRKKPIVVEAIKYNDNHAECEKFCGRENLEYGKVDEEGLQMFIVTSEGTMKVNEGDYIIKEPFDKERMFYPCKPNIFKETYEKVE